MKNFLSGRKLLKGEGSLASRKKSAGEITNIPVRLMKNMSEKEEFLTFVKGIKDPTDQTVLVWYQGNLHLLHRRPSKFPRQNLWNPLTLIGHELENAPLLAKFVNKSFPQIDEFTRKMKQFRTSFVRDDLNINLVENTIRTMNHEMFYRLPRMFDEIPGYVHGPDFKRRHNIYIQENPDTSLSVKDYPNCPPRYYQYANPNNFVLSMFGEIISVPSQFDNVLPTAKFTEIPGFGQLCIPSD
ncbi:BgTH12-07762 [Blumeria graminis f. sp. triticale]|uniref:BgTH12-07762 n=1 Tax=Blumeria graminis f. sp. triticale TaxID=1689686 RepID=A0A9W4DEW0_BLUGR|nr:BgTH12-07762 [Blumeria graminis f. sp. triticale]